MGLRYCGRFGGGLRPPSRRSWGRTVRSMSIVATAILSLALSFPAAASSWFPFVIPLDDATPNTPTDVSFLNRPIEPVVAKGSHFVGKTTGKRIRFVAVNFAAKANFPSHADAEKVAARLAKYGANLVRMHHMDNLWGPSGSIWDWNKPGHTHIDAGQRDKMDYLVAQLEKHGIYVDINLHVSRQFTQADGFPASVDQIPFSFDKRVDQFDPMMIELQKDYAKDLLTHVNPYTHKAYFADPGVAMVEINNENSLEGDPWSGIGSGLENIPDPFRSELDGLWNDWLKKTYSTDAAMKAAWTKDVTPEGPSLLGPDSKWHVEVNGGAADISPTGQSDAGKAPDQLVNVTAVDGTDWHIQATIVGLTVKKGAVYTVRFRAKADAPRSIGVNLQLGIPNWDMLGLAVTSTLSTDWKDYQYSFNAGAAKPGFAKLDFVVGNAVGMFWLSDVSLSSGIPNAGMPVGESIAQSNISIPASGGAATGAWHDWVRFLSDTETAYANGMRKYLKADLGVKANVIESQLGFGGMTSVRREMDMDYADSHAYWQHPSFPHKQWDMTDWNIPNTSMVSDMAKGGGGTLRELAEYRIAGKPYAVSEYDHPAPSDYQSECVPEIFSFAAAQDWDAVFLFDYGDYGTGADNDKIQSFFANGSNPAKWAFLPAAAMLFRAGLIAPLPKTETATIPLQGQGWVSYLVPSDVWKGDVPFLTSRLSLVPTNDTLKPSRRRGTTHATDPTTILMNGSAMDRAAGLPTTFMSDPLYSVFGKRAVVFTGFVNGTTIDDSEKGKLDSRFQFKPFGNNFVSVMLVPMDALPLTKSKHLLLTVVGKVENQDMGWNADRTSVGDKWGHGPVRAEVVPGTVTLAVDGKRVVRDLTSTGTVERVLSSTYNNGKLTFRIGDANTLWYSITAQ